MTGIQAIKQMVKKYKAEGYYTGLYVTNLLTNTAHKGNISIIIRGMTVATIIQNLNSLGSINKTDADNENIHDNYLIEFKGNNDQQVYQIRLPRVGKKKVFKKTGTLEEDSKHGDFTITSMYLPINYRSTNKVIDFVKGKADVKNKVIRAIGDPSARIYESPIRILNVIYYYGLGFSIDPKLFQALKKTKGLLRVLKMGVIRDEFTKIILSEKPSSQMTLMKDLGIIKILLPELHECASVSQPEIFHKYDVFDHCTHTCDNVEPELTLRLAALFHDVGKAQAVKILHGKTSFHNHEMMGGDITYNILRRLNYDSKTIEAVVNLIKLHMYHYIKSWTNPAVDRFIRRAGITKIEADKLDEHPLFKLRLADRAGSGVKPATVTKLQKELQERIKKRFEKPKPKFKNREDVINDTKIKTMVKTMDGITLKLLIDMFVNNNNYKIVNDLVYFMYRSIKEKHCPNNKLQLVKLAIEYVSKKEKTYN